MPLKYLSTSLSINNSLLTHQRLTKELTKKTEESLSNVPSVLRNQDNGIDKMCAKNTVLNLKSLIDKDLQKPMIGRGGRGASLKLRNSLENF